MEGLRIGRDSSVGIATRYGLNGPGIESRLGRYFLHPSRSAYGPPSLLFNVYRVSFLGVRRPRHGDRPPPSSATVKERVELYLCAPLCLHGLFWGELYLFTSSKAQYHIPQDVTYHQSPVWEPKFSHFRKCLNANRLIKRALGSTIPLLLLLFRRARWLMPSDVPQPVRLIVLTLL
jgi:hypothetical protein